MQVQTKLRVLASDLAASARTYAFWFYMAVACLKCVALMSLGLLFATQMGDMVDVIEAGVGVRSVHENFLLSAIVLMSPIAVIWALLLVFFGRCRCEHEV